MVEQRQYETDDFEAQDKTYDLTGTLTDPDGDPISDTDLTVKSEDGNEYSVTTDSDGKFIVESLTAGKYSVTLDSDDYGQLSEEHTIGDDNDEEDDDNGDDDESDDSAEANNEDAADASDN